MSLTPYIQQIQVHLIQTLAQFLYRFKLEEPILHYRPRPEAWTAFEILEHVSLTSHYLLILIDKGTGKALRNIKGLSLEEELANFDFDLEKLEAIGITKAFPWPHPEHMTPRGDKSLIEIQQELIQQLARCLNYLEDLKNGEGLLYQTTMTVNDLGKLNVYEYIYFLSMHMQRHDEQIEQNRLAYFRSLQAGGE